MPLPHSGNYRASATLAALVVIFISCLTMPVSRAGEGTPYRVGVILPLSGEYASLGTYVRNGVELAHSTLPDPLKTRIELLFEDDQLQSAKAVSAFQKLTAIDKVDAVFVISSGIGNAVAPLAEGAKKVIVAIGASDNTIVQNKKYAFIHWVSPEAEAKAMVDEIVQRGYSRIGSITVEQEGALALETALRDELKKRGLGGRMVVTERALPGERDFKTTIAKLRAANLDGIAVVLLPGSLSTFVKSATRSQLTADLFGFETFEDSAEVKASEYTLVGKWYVNAADGSEEFSNLYRSKYGAPAGWAAANGFDALRMIVHGLELHGNDNDKLSEYLATVKGYHGATGNYSATGDHRFTLPASIKLVERDGFKKIR